MNQRARVLAAVIAEHMNAVHPTTNNTVKEGILWANCEAASHPNCGMCPLHNRPRYACGCNRVEAE